MADTAAKRPILLLAGATGALGRSVLGEAVRRGYDVRALVHRTPLGRAHSAHVTAWEGDALVSSQLAGVCDGVDVVSALLTATCER